MIKKKQIHIKFFQFLSFGQIYTRCFRLLFQWSKLFGQLA